MDSEPQSTLAVVGHVSPIQHFRLHILILLQTKCLFSFYFPFRHPLSGSRYRDSCKGWHFNCTDSVYIDIPSCRNGLW